MDHRRMIMPRIQKPRLYTLRGCDYDADSGVLPTEKEQEQFRMKVVKVLFYSMVLNRKPVFLITLQQILEKGVWDDK